MLSVDTANNVNRKSREGARARHAREFGALPGGEHGLLKARVPNYQDLAAVRLGSIETGQAVQEHKQAHIVPGQQRMTAQSMRFGVGNACEGLRSTVGLQ